MTSQRHPQAGKEKAENYDVFVEKGDAAAAERAGGGVRSRGFVTIEEEGGALSLCVRNFWRQHPDELQVDAAHGALWAWFWADHGGKALDNWNPRFGYRVPPLGGDLEVGRGLPGRPPE